ncbi:MAG: hypothetical protein ACRDWE_10385, partial [Acidimicrobiales bacterium]
FLVRAAQRASRSGAPSRAVQLYARAAAIAPPEWSPALYEEAANAAAEAGEHEEMAAHARLAREGHVRVDSSRGAARARALEGTALRFLEQHGIARGLLEESLVVLREDPDVATVRALRHLAAVEHGIGNVVTGVRLITEALELAQAIGVGTSDLALLFNSRGALAATTSRLAEAACDYRASAHLAERAGDYGALALAQGNLADVLVQSDPKAAADVARSAVAHARRAGNKDHLSLAFGNLAVALTELGEWDEAVALARDGVEVDQLEHMYLLGVRGELAALRGDRAVAAAAQESVARYRGSEDVQSQSILGLLDATAALCTGDSAGALALALGVLERAEAAGIGTDSVRWAWPLAARAARSLGERAVRDDLRAMLDAHPTGHLPPILRAERTLEDALAAFDDAGPGATPGARAVADAVEGLRRVGNPYQLAHGLVDLAEIQGRAGEDGADAALAEAREIAERLGCLPLLARADAVATKYAPSGARS